MLSGHCRSFIIVLQYEATAPHAQKLADEIQSLGNWWHCIHGIWIVKTTAAASEIRDRLRKRLQEDDRLLILEIGRDVAWAGVAKEAAAWLKDNLLERGASPQARSHSSELACS